jgi:hypothetical protein
MENSLAMANDQDVTPDETRTDANAAINWAFDTGNPRNWSFARRAVTTAVVSGIGFVRYVVLRLCWT